jgi:beta-lactamase regulating signal transducer with metallopeptidase domain
MIPSAEMLNTFAAAWTVLMGSILWQSTVLALVVGGISFRFRRSSPSMRYWLWQIIAIRLLILPLWTLTVPGPSLLSSSIAMQPTVVSDNRQGVPASLATRQPAIPGKSPDLLVIRHGSLAESPPLLAAFCELTPWAWLFLLWALVVLGQIVHLLHQRFLLGCLLRGAKKETNLAILQQLGTLAGRLNLRRVPILLATESDCSPFVCGLWRPRLIMPKPLLVELGPEQLEQIFLHELAHILRNDLVWGWLAELARLFWFFHPVARWASARIRLERELACDQLAMALSRRSAADYALVLVDVVSHVAQPSALKIAAASSFALDGGAGPAACEQPS